MAEMIYLDGVMVALEGARIDPRDRGFLLGDGVFETILYSDGRLLWLDDHLRRLRHSAEVLQLPVPSDFTTLSTDLLALCQQSGHRTGALRLTLTRGVTDGRKIWPVESVPPTIMARVTGLGESRVAAAVHLVTVRSIRRDSQSPLLRIKSLNYGAAILARIEAEQKGGDDGLSLNQGRELTSTSVGNIFMRLDEGWFTPPESVGILAGLARQRLMILLAAEERVLTESDSATARQAFISNSLQLTPVHRLDGRGLEPLSLDSLAERLYR
ncbi:MAG: aminotransferase class IV [Candidatus Pacebacteria bacterium]|nr:aminotransferase class IV [Candidatus Paceibacterota bacterium]